MTRARAIVLTTVGVAFMAASVAGQAPDPKLVAAGKKSFNDKKWDCVKCHSAEGTGNKKLAMERLKKMPPEEIKKWITSPVEMTAKLPKKPTVPMKKQDIPAAEVDALVAYIWSVQQ